MAAMLAVVVLLALIGVARLVSSYSSKPVVTSRTPPVSIAALQAKSIPAEQSLGPNETLVLPPGR